MSIKVICAIAFALVMAVAFFSSSSTSAPPAGSVEKETSSPTRNHIDIVQNPTVQETNTRAGRFLAGYESPKNYRVANLCNKDGEVCSAGVYGSAGMTTCCKNKCVDFKYDQKNCGECGNKCKYTQSCCGGKCIYLAYDKSNCGACHHKCGKGQPCLYGMCNYV